MSAAGWQAVASGTDYMVLGGLQAVLRQSWPIGVYIVGSARET